ncbi:nucleotidyltransferase domain-containing protein [Eoetvoesiella caeni]|uniref:ArsR family transcriptional regulator n=1 Tax=Eoetvoesiella caeni TaxID=645616 RepID=A0A366HGE8_9BURK|nr:nucleotidyltransferase domain-containing protein [Eoetvoesiella caeni]MCI2807820.1 nucleotidyltransferase domain-containing protein [Eoetvoesiella caeni]NYT54178.1 nucleotidyltransferase domain-containing protein [Eoetvoesiella caeni]RBP41735.1 ArsR family transcriptional regulator [Eoetvoesiella caeni]
MLRNLSETLFGGYRRRALGLLLLRPDESFHVREIARLTHTAPGTLHKELARLAEAGILERETRGNQLLYRANRNCPIYTELSGIFRKTVGAADIIAQALIPYSDQIDIAFVYGSVARGQEIASSDIDIMLIGSINFSSAIKLLYPIQTELKREISPKVFSIDEWQVQVHGNNQFLTEVLSSSKIFLIGNEHDLGKLTGPNTGKDQT